MRILSVAVCLWLYSALGYAYGAEAPPDELWKALIAENIGYADRYVKMKATACVVRNRLRAGLKHGLVGMKRKDLDTFVEKNCDYVEALTGENYRIIAREIIEDVFSNNIDIVNGATHYEDLGVYPEPYWAPAMDIVHRLGTVVYYKEKD